MEEETWRGRPGAGTGSVNPERDGVLFEEKAQYSSHHDEVIRSMSLFGVKTELECLPCFFGQITRTLSYAGVNGDRGRGIGRMAEKVIESASLDEVPARTTTLIHRILRNETGVDPYKQVKETYNRIALDRLPALRRMADNAADRLEGGARIAIAGNVIDFGIYDSVDLDRSLDESFRLPLSETDFRGFSQAVRRARRILYLCDNAGEIVFDRVLIEILRDLGKDVTAAVKGSPVINDATLDDAHAAGLHECAAVIDNGSDGIGTLLEACSAQFTAAYRSADLIISKGRPITKRSCRKMMSASFSSLKSSALSWPLS